MGGGGGGLENNPSVGGLDNSETTQCESSGGIRVMCLKQKMALRLAYL